MPVVSHFVSCIKVIHSVIVTPPDSRNAHEYASSIKLLLAVSEYPSFAPLLVERGLLLAITSRLMNVRTAVTSLC